MLLGAAFSSAAKVTLAANANGMVTPAKSQIFYPLQLS
jgi:hypothetical protein